MAFGFPARHAHTERHAIDDAQLYDLVRRGARALGWVLTHDDGKHLVARRGVNLLSWGEVLRASIEDGVLRLESRCRLPTQCFDWGKNERNVNALLALLPIGRQLGLPASGGASGAPVAAGATVGDAPATALPRAPDRAATP